VATAAPVDLLEATNLELYEHAEAILRSLEDEKVEDAFEDLIQEVFERFAPEAQIEYLRRVTYKNRPEDFAEQRVWLAERAFQRTYGVPLGEFHV
jgi:hypothetical protein